MAGATAFNYNRIGDGGYLCYFYNVGQKWVIGPNSYEIVDCKLSDPYYSNTNAAANSVLHRND